MASSVAGRRPRRGARRAAARWRAGRTSSLTATAGSPPVSRCRVVASCRSRPVYRDAGPILLVCSLCHAQPDRVNRPGPQRPAIPATVDTVPPLPPIAAGPPAARWRAGCASSRPSPSRANGASATSPARPDIPRSAAHRILHDMAAPRPARAGRRGRVASGSGPDLARIGQLVAEHLDVRRVGRPFLERASAAIGETVVIAVYDPHRRQFSAVDAVETSHPIRYIWESLRDWSDLHLGSSGKGILAFLPPRRAGRRSSTGCRTRSPGAPR